MTCSLLHLNDYRVQLLDPQGERLASSAQLAFDNKILLSGAEALAIARKKPLHAYNQHWQQLSQAPIKLPDSALRHHADLAYRQLNIWLSDLDKSEPLIVAPSYRYQESQYALLAGMLQAMEIKSVGFIHSALLHSYGYIQAESDRMWPLIHIDICLHQAHITQLAVRNDKLVVEREWDLPSAGIMPIINGWMKIVAKSCIKQTRYNPLYSADSEQRLFSQWHQTMAALCDSSRIEIDVDGNTVELSREQFEPLTKELYTQVENLSGTRLISPVAHILPGISGFQLTDHHLVKPLEHLDLELSGSVQLHRSLPLPAPARLDTASPDSHTNGNTEATHILVGHCAFPLTDSFYLKQVDDQWHISTEADQASPIGLQKRGGGWQCQTASSCRLDDQSVSGSFYIKLGQILVLDNTKIQLVRVYDHGA